MTIVAAFLMAQALGADLLPPESPFDQDDPLPPDATLDRPFPRRPDIVRTSLTYWKPSIKGSYVGRDLTDPDVPDAPKPRVDLRDEAGMDGSHPVHGFAWAVYAPIEPKEGGTPDIWGGVSMEYRRGTWRSSWVTDIPLNFDQLTVPAGSPITTAMEHDHFTLSLSGMKRSENGAWGALEGGIALIRTSLEMKTPEDKVKSGSGTVGFRIRALGELPVTDFLAARADIGTVIPLFVSAAEADASVGAGLSLGGFSLDVGYNLTYTSSYGSRFYAHGPTLGLSVTF